MKMKLAQFVIVVLLCTTSFVRECSAAVSYVWSPTLSPPDLINAPTIDFEGYPVFTAANSLFQNQGITFSRDDGNSITIVNQLTLGIAPPFDNNLLWTGSSPPTEGTLEIQSSIPLYAIGALITSSGLTAPGDFLSMTVFDSSGHLLGSVPAHFGFPSAPFAFFEGLQSTIPFSRVRFDSPLGIGTTLRSLQSASTRLCAVGVPLSAANPALCFDAVEQHFFREHLLADAALVVTPTV